ncbi:hypothetical protein HY572_04280 [Candidatus Micrarchaeota archaeon]|nr:hypothetical protein [Candidatus Micrarchaeota archaeon]
MALKTAAGDTSALVSLELAGALTPSFSIVSWKIARAVVDELKELAGFDDRVGQAAKKILALIKSGKMDAAPVRVLPSVTGLVDVGEASAFTLCIREKIPLLVCDDVEAGYRLDGLAQAEGIRIVISAAVIVELVKQGTWSKNQGNDAILRMIDSRGWQDGVLEYLCRKHLKDE